MRYFLMIFVCAVMVAFGAISMVESYTPANAGIGGAGDDDTAPGDDGGNPFHECHDDGDDGENPGVYDDPDSEDDEGPLGEVGDKEDDDDFYEDDDPFNCRVILPDTSTPSPTPCPSLVFTDGGGGSSECCPLGSGSTGDVGGEGFTCVCFNADGQVIDAGTGGPPCFCQVGDFGCLCDITQFSTTPDCCVYFGGCVSQVATAPADVDCDGSVTPMDAYETLIALSGFESDACGGDADCSEAVDAKDTLAILAVVAGLRSAATC
jgi:hypothetical protein